LSGMVGTVEGVDAMPIALPAGLPA
jgi:hypothetical protein